MIRIGTSGYSFPDWKGTFYPKNIKPENYFDYYMKYFDCVEINLTFYTIPKKDLFFSLARKAGEGFLFAIKIPSLFTHTLELSGPVISKFKALLEPLENEKKLGPLLAQFPYSFKFNRENINYIVKLKNALLPFQLFVEFRSKEWDTEETYNFIRSESLGIVFPDLPPIPALFHPKPMPIGQTLYFRFHGRNKKGWWEGKEKERYDYNYSSAEIHGLVSTLKAFDSPTRLVFGFFNNCFLGRAARNAQEALKILGKKFEAEEKSLFDENSAGA